MPEEWIINRHLLQSAGNQEPQKVKVDMEAQANGGGGHWLQMWRSPQKAIKKRTVRVAALQEHTEAESSS